MNKLRFLFVILPVFALVSSCKDEAPVRRDAFNNDYMSRVYPDNFTATVSNSFLPLTPGSTFVYISETSVGTERVEFEVLEETRIIMGIECVVIRDMVFLNNELIEDTYDWYAQDKDGNVWYMGEDVDNYENGVVINHYGSWEAGVDGAEPGVMMLANPVPGLYYRQEHYVGEAEDQAEVVGVNETITVPAGTFTGCLNIKETNPLDPDFLEYKFYAPGVGLIKVQKIGTPVETEELISYDLK